MSNKSLFDRSNQLLTGSVFEKIIKYRTFIHIKSIFKDAWYNFIVPLTQPNELDWLGAKRIIRSEQKNGFSLSYYIYDSFLSEYSKYFEQHKHENLGTEFYMYLRQSKEYQNVSGELVEIDPSNLERFVEITKSHFPDWVSNEEYSRHFFRLQSKMVDPVIKNFIYRVNGEDVGTCGIILSKKQNLSYLHNMGVLKQYRRMGHFTNNTKLLINLSLSHGITDTYALVDEIDGSFLGFKKIGFEIKEKYYLFDSFPVTE